jgi:predicted glycosyltransferase
VSAPRVLLYAQHLLGVGHLMRAALLARALAAGGFDIELASGGLPVAGLPLGDARLVQLPPARSADERFSGLLDAAGRPVDDAWMADRRDRLLGRFAARRPDLLILEMFPFGRRQMRFELLPLLEAALAVRPRPVIACSVRDILQGRKPGRAEETAALVERAFDLVLVHGDPALVRFEESFPLAGRLGAKLRYTGYIAARAPRRGRAGDPGWGEVVVSAGGGAVGQALLEAGLGARSLSRLADVPWRLLAGRNLPEPTFAMLAERAGPEVIVERARPDFPQLLANCRISVSQAGYNTVMDIVNAQARAVLVPFVGAGETEQSLRAGRLARRGLAQSVPETALDPARLAAAIDAADAMPTPDFARIDRRGAEASVEILRAALAERAASPEEAR